MSLGVSNSSQPGLIIRQDGAEAIVKRFANIEAAAADLRPVWGELKARFVAAERATFAAQGGASGRWPRLSERYAAEKARKHPGKTIMRATDALFHSLTDTLDIDVREPTMMILGSAVAYGGFHQRGSGHNKVRKTIDLSRAELQTWTERIAKHLIGGSTLGAEAAA